ncbi:MAG: hypothetical protein ISR86_06640 [Nitrospinaceae bacterium]|nr:hypothetical protein [Candidatus Brocadiales bacterium]MBL7020205.1 hypothetical protein [Nitrospinaceae bacterium]
MKRFIQTAIVLGVAIGLWQVSADARFLDLQKEELAPALNPEATPIPPSIPIIPIYKSEVSPQGISLQFEDLTLLDVLRNIQEETGILFSIDPSLETVPFNARIQADSWESAIKELLKGFSRVEVWTSNLETSRVWVLSGGREEVGTKKPDIRLKRQARAQPAIQSPPQVRLHPAPVPQPVASSTTRIEDLPPHILFEPGVLTFFKSSGIQLPDNVKNMFGPNLEGLPANMPISPHILNDPTFINFLNAQGIQVPLA